MRAPDIEEVWKLISGMDGVQQAEADSGQAAGLERGCSEGQELNLKPLAMLPADWGRRRKGEGSAALVFMGPPQNLIALHLGSPNRHLSIKKSTPISKCLFPYFYLDILLPTKFSFSSGHCL